MSSDSNHVAAARLFSHVVAERAPLYRAILATFAAARRQFRLHLRPDEVLAEAAWPGAAPDSVELQAALDQLVEWGNLQAQADTSRVATLEDFYRRRLLYRVTAGGEAAEAGLEAFASALVRRAELQSVALDDIVLRLGALRELARDETPDPAKVHGAMRDLAHVFEGLARDAEAFMAGLARTLELQRAELAAVLGFKARLIDYLQRFVGDLVVRSDQIGALLGELEPRVPALLRAAAERDARDALADDEAAATAAVSERERAWAERWRGLSRWFVASAARPQAELLRATALSAIPRLLQAVSLLNERRSGRSDRAADFRQLALWFAEAQEAADAHRLWRAAFALSPARHLALLPEARETPATTPWRDAPAAAIHPKLRERGALPTRGGPTRIADRSRERALLAERTAEEAAQTEAARRRLAARGDTTLSQLGPLNAPEFRLFLALLGDALAAQPHPDAPVERFTADGSLIVRLEPLAHDSRATLETELGRFGGRDHRLSIREA